jgi:hypothetical protein
MISPVLARETSNISGSRARVSGLSGEVRNVYETDDVTLTLVVSGSTGKNSSPLI